jgi:ArsR family transcriptional regulator
LPAREGRAALTAAVFGDALQPRLDGLLSPDEAVSLATVFKALSVPVRLRFLLFIASHVDGEACGDDMVRACGVSSPAVSRHLRVLRDAGLITARRQGQRIQYRIVSEAMACLSEVFHAATASGKAAIGHR